MYHVELVKTMPKYSSPLHRSEFYIKAKPSCQSFQSHSPFLCTKLKVVPDLTIPSSSPEMGIRHSRFPHLSFEDCKGVPQTMWSGAVSVSP